MTAKAIDRDFVRHVGGQVLAAQLAARRDPATVTGDHLDGIADMSIRAAMALDAAIPRAEERMAAEAKAAEEKAAADAKAEAAAKAAAAEAARVAAKDAADTAVTRAAAEKAAEKEAAAAATASTAAIKEKTGASGHR